MRNKHPVSGGAVAVMAMLSCLIYSFSTGLTGNTPDPLGAYLPAAKPTVAVVHYSGDPEAVVFTIRKAGASAIYSNVAASDEALMPFVRPVRDLTPPSVSLLYYRVPRAELGRGVLRLEHRQVQKTTALLQSWTVVMDGYREGPPPASDAAAVVATALSDRWLLRSPLLSLLLTFLASWRFTRWAIGHGPTRVLLRGGVVVIFGVISLFALRALGLVVHPAIVVACILPGSLGSFAVWFKAMFEVPTPNRSIVKP